MKKENKIILSLYLLSHGLILLISNAIYWDDWIIYNVDKEIIFKNFHESAVFVPFVSYLHSYILPIGPWFYRLLTLFSFLFISYLFNKILLSLKFLNKENRFIIILFFTLLPFNIARVALIDFPYTICLTLFFIAWRYKNIRYISLPLFFISFTTNSLPFLYLIVLFHIYYESYTSLNNKFSWRILFNKIDYILLPIIFVAIKYTYYIPYGNYINYNNDFSLYNLFSKPISQFLHSGYFLINIKSNIFLLLIVTYTVSKILPNFNNNYNLPFTKKQVFIFGVFSTILVLFPYWIVGHIPTFIDWNSRHQLLMPFGISLIFFSIYYFLNFKKWFLISIISISISININFYFDLFKDWNKQMELVSIFEDSSEEYADKILIIKDYTDNALERTFRNYEWEGLLNLKNNNTIAFDISMYNEKLDTIINEKFPEFKNNDFVFISINYKEHLKESKRWKRVINKLKNNIYPKFSFNTITLD